MKTKTIFFISVIISLIAIIICYTSINTEIYVSSEYFLNKALWDINIIEVIPLKNTQAITKDENKISFNSSIKKPGDISSIKIVIYNEGNITALLSSINKKDIICSGSSEKENDYVCDNLKLYVTDENGNEVSFDSLLLPKNSQTYIINLEYNENADLPTEKVDLYIDDLEFNYIQK